MDIILASGSLRRIEIMKELGFDFKIIPSLTLEFVDEYKDNFDLVKKLALMKARDIYKSNKENIVLGFDTLVFLGNEVLGKPQSKEECIKMIKELSGKTHEVITGCAIIYNDKEEVFTSHALVTFTDISDEEILKYSDSTEPYDKAGAYAIQGYMGRFISKIEGDIFSVIGLPKSLIYSKLNNILKECNNK